MEKEKLFFCNEPEHSSDEEEGRIESIQKQKKVQIF